MLRILSILASRACPRCQTARYGRLRGWPEAACLLSLAASLGCTTLRPEGAAANVVSARQLSLRGMDAMQRQRWNDAETLFATAVQTNPADERAHRRYAELLWRRGLQDKAIGHMEQSVRLSGGDPELLVQLGGMYLERGNVDAAWRQAEQAIAAHRQLACAWALRGDIQRRRNQWSEAMTSYHRALCYEPHYPQVQLALAELYGQQHRPQRALATLAALVEQYGPDQAPVKVLLLQGLALKELGRYDDAIDVLQLASRRGETDIDVLHQLSEAHWLAGDVANAGLTVQAALARDPVHEPSRRLHSEIQAWQRSMTAGLRPALSGS